MLSKAEQSNCTKIFNSWRAEENIEKIKIVHDCVFQI